jgi:hypothetical protein
MDSDYIAIRQILYPTKNRKSFLVYQGQRKNGVWKPLNKPLAEELIESGVVLIKGDE